MEVSLESFKKRFTYDPQKDLLGKGGYSEVYKAYDTEDKIFVALKIYQGDTESKYNLSNEIRKFKRLRHPNVIEHLETYDVTTGNNDIHGNPIKYQIGILEYANAGTLADLIKQGQLTGSVNAAKLESIAKDIISGLEYLHSQNIIHRDLKPSNILLFKQGEKLIPKICDFGIAKVMDNATAVSTQLVGTVEYMAPEYFRTDLGDIGKASDLWSLGVILLEAASGQHPFGKASEGYSNGQIINNILSKEKINLNVIQDASILEIVRGLLNPNPQDRQYKNVGTEVKYTSESIQNPAEPKLKPLVVSDTKVWKAIKHLFFIDFKEPKKQKFIAIELLIALMTVFLPLLVVLAGDDIHHYRTFPILIPIFYYPVTRIILSIIVWSLDVLGIHVKISLKTMKRILWSFLLLIVIALSFFLYPIAKAFYHSRVEWVSIPAGTFVMGSPTDEFGHRSDESQREVTLSAFKMSKYEVTFEQYDAFCEATNCEKPDDNGWGRGKRPVINVSIYDAVLFANWMGCRLPTEEEWEYACRAGTITPYNTGDNISDKQANIHGSETKLVGTYAPNAWGLCDMHGNVEELCPSFYRPSSGPAEGGRINVYRGGSWHRVSRGGSWSNSAFYCRSANRSIGGLSEYMGFRLVSTE